MMSLMEYLFLTISFFVAYTFRKEIINFVKTRIDFNFRAKAKDDQMVDIGEGVTDDYVKGLVNTVESLKKRAHLSMDDSEITSFIQKCNELLVSLNKTVVGIDMFQTGAERIAALEKEIAELKKAKSK